MVTCPLNGKHSWMSRGWLWAKGDSRGKCCGIFVSTGLQGGSQETTCLKLISTLVHHGISYIPLGYKTTMPLIARFDEAHGGSPWGAGTFAGADGSRKPTKLELDMAKIQGRDFNKYLARIDFAMPLAE